MSNIYALIQSDSIVNIVIASSTDIQDPNYTWIDITSINPQPGINWTYNGIIFTAPTPPAGPTQQQIVEAEIQACIDGFNAIMVSYAAQNVLAGITAAGKTQLIANTLSTVMQYGQSGSLLASISALEAITLTDEMSPYLTSSIITSLVAQANAVLASL